MALVLGVSAFYHDSAACLVRDGEIIAAAQEERFTRRVGDSALPVKAAAACVARAGVEAPDVDALVFYEKPLLKLERVLQNHLEVAPRGLWQWRMMARRLWTERVNIERTLRSVLPGFRGEVAFVEHHESHAASAYFPSPFTEAAVLTVDGVGEWATAAWGEGHGEQLALCEEMQWPDSLGLLYSAVTAALGFRVNRDEYKVMGLSAYGTPRYVSWLERTLVQRHADGSCTLRPGLLTFWFGKHMVSTDFENSLGSKLRTAEGELTDAARDLAASVQCVLEEQLLAMASYVARRTGARALCFAGGVAHNCVANGRLHREGPFDGLWIQPAAGDAGGALGAALLGWYRLSSGKRRAPSIPDGMRGSLLGNEITPSEAREAALAQGLDVVQSAGGSSLDFIADALAAGQLVAVASGAMEFGARALGNRSILADARRPGVRDELNVRIKHREAFRPFAPAVLAEYASEVFEHVTASPYMLEAAPVRNGTSPGGRDWRTLIAGAVHVDGSARLQTVDANHDGPLRGILERFYARTGCPVLINTSFNDSDMPIVASATDACLAMERTQVDLMLLGDIIVRRDPHTGLRRAASAPQQRQRQGFWRAVLSALHQIPRLAADLVVTAVFFTVVVPMSIVYRGLKWRLPAPAKEGSSWQSRGRAHSDIQRMY
jgi:carbamoyltransferase